MDNKTFIKVYDNAISDTFCDELIQKFESNQDQWEKRDMSSAKRTLSFNEIHCFNHMETWEDDTKKLADTFIQYIDDYKSNYHEYCFPKKFGFEPFKMKKYDSNGVDEFGWHVDQHSQPYSDGRVRKISFSVFLNDDFEGGEFDIETGNPKEKKRYTTIKGKSNHAFFFQSDYWHRVRPITKGVRKSLVGWVLGPKFR